MIRAAVRGLTLGGMLAVAAAAHAAPPADTPAVTPNPSVMALVPDPQEFVARADTRLTVLGTPKRLAGVNLPWLGLKQNLTPPTAFEMTDAFRTANVLGAAVVRSISLGLTVGCAECLVTRPGELNPAALRHLDRVLRLAHDFGLKLIVPLTGIPGCDGPPRMRALQTACAFARAAGKPEAAFYTDPDIRAAFLQTVALLLRHVSAESGLALNDDAAVMAWENCLGCGAAGKTAEIGAWTQAVGQAIKAIDIHHLYENGAFPGAITTTPAEALAPPSVDIVGDRVFPAPDAAARSFAASAAVVGQANRAYVIDEYAWSAASFPTAESFDAFLAAIIDTRGLAISILQSLSAHADGGGFLQPASADPVLSFPGNGADDAAVADMNARARALRRMSFGLMRLNPPGIPNAKAPEILSAVHGHVTWRGGTGAQTYSILRSDDASAPDSWSELCHACLTDARPDYQDPRPPTAPAWYRLLPYNLNGHVGLPSAPVRNR